MTPIQTESISGFRSNYDGVLKKLSNGPVLLLQRSNLAAVLVSPVEWNQLTVELQQLRRLLAADQHFAEMKAGKFVTQEELDKQLGTVGLV